jgi:hypothetical protein
MEILTIQPFLHYFANLRERTVRVARCIPPDKIEWTYADGKFTLGDLLRHLAVIERLYAEMSRATRAAIPPTAKSSPMVWKIFSRSWVGSTPNRWTSFRGSATKT